MVFLILGEILNMEDVVLKTQKMKMKKAIDI
jgi:hypothetical protein